jgi:hypothetical protein
MNALIFATVLAGTTRMSVSTAADVWLFLLVIEWLADRFAGSLRHGWAGYWSALRMQAAVHEIRPSGIEHKYGRGY